jgi:L-iditol 2-dehydrogenase
VSGFDLGERVVVPHHVACGSCALCRRGADTKCEDFLENLMSPGGFSTKVLIRPRAVSRAVFRVPDAVSDAQASFIEPSACVLRGIRKAELEPTEGCAAVLGAGTMGQLHLLVLRAARPGVEVVVCDPMEERQQDARRLGAAAVCAPEDLEATISRVSGGVGSDAVFDTVGGAGPLQAGLSSTRPGGVVVLFAHAREGEVAGFELNPFFKAERRVVATYSGGLDEQARMAELIFSGTLDPAPLVSHRMPLSRFNEAVELSMNRQAYKILVEPDP